MSVLALERSLLLCPKRTRLMPPQLGHKYPPAQGAGTQHPDEGDVPKVPRHNTPGSR